MLLSDATALYGDLNGGQLGDVLLEDGRTFMATFGSKCDRGGAGKPMAMPAASEPGSGAASLVDSARCATVLLFATFRKSWRSSPAVSPPPGRAVILPGRLPWQRGRRKCGRSLPASDRHPGAQPPDFRAAVPRLSGGVTPPQQLIGAPSGRSPTGPPARPDGTPLVSGRAACCGRERRSSSTQACCDPSSRRRCGTPPRGRTDP